MGRPPKPDAEKTRPRNFRLRDATFDRIAELAAMWGCSHSEAIARAIDREHDRAHWPVKED